MPNPDWVNRYLGKGDYKYGTSGHDLYSGLISGTVKESLNQTYTFVKKANKDFLKKMVIDGKDFNELSPTDITVDKPKLVGLEKFLKYMTGPANPAKPQDGYAAGSHLVEKLKLPEDEKFGASINKDYGIDPELYNFDKIVSSQIENWKWKDYFTYEQWRTDILPHVLKISFLEMLDKVSDSYAKKLNSENKLSSAEKTGKMYELAVNLSDEFEKYTEYLANETEYLAKPIRGIKTDYTNSLDRDELDKLKGSGISKDEYDKLSKLYKKLSPAVSKNKLEKMVKDRLSGVPLSNQNSLAENKKKKIEKKDALAKQQAQSKKAEVLSDRNKQPEKTEAPSKQDPEKKSEQEVIADKAKEIPEIPAGTPKWVAKAAGYDTRGFLESLTGDIKENLYQTGTSYGLNYAKNFVKDYINDWRASKVICGKDFSPLTTSTKLMTSIIQFGSDKGLDVVDKYLAKYENYVSTTDVDINALSGQIKTDPQLTNSLYNLTGLEIDGDTISQGISRVIRNAVDEDGVLIGDNFSYEKWANEIMPHLIRKEYDRQLDRIYTKMADNYNKEGSIASKELLESSLRKAAVKLGKVFEEFSTNLANDTPYLAAPVKMSNDERRNGKYLEQFKDLPRDRYNSLKKALENNKPLFKESELNEKIKKITNKAPERNSETSLRHILQNRNLEKIGKKPQTPEEQAAYADKTASSYIKSILALRDMKKQNENRNFFTKYIFNSAYKNKKQAIAEYEKNIAESFGYSKDVVSHLTDLKVPFENVLPAGEMMGVEQVKYVPDSKLASVGKTVVEKGIQGLLYFGNNVAKVTKWTGKALQFGGNIVYENSGKIGEVIKEQASQIKDGMVYIGKKGVDLASSVGGQIVKAGGGVVNLAKNVGTGVAIVGSSVVTGAQTVIGTGVSIVNSGVNMVKNVGSSIYNTGASLFSGVYNYFAGSNDQPEKIDEEPAEEEEEQVLEEDKKEEKELSKNQDEIEKSKQKDSPVTMVKDGEDFYDTEDSLTDLINNNLKNDVPQNPEPDKKEEIIQNNPEQEKKEEIPQNNDEPEPDDDDEIYEDPREHFIDEDEPDQDNEPESDADEFEDCNSSLGDDEELSPEEDLQNVWKENYDALNKKINQQIQVFQKDIQNPKASKLGIVSYAGLITCRELSDKLSKINASNLSNEKTPEELSKQIEQLNLIDNVMTEPAFRKQIIERSKNDKELIDAYKIYSNRFESAVKHEIKEEMNRHIQENKKPDVQKNQDIKKLDVQKNQDNKTVEHEEKTYDNMTL